MASPDPLRAFLRRLPEPVAFVLDGDTRVQLTKGAHRFSEVESVIRSRAPGCIDAIDKSGEVLRSFGTQPDVMAEPVTPAVVVPETPDQKTLGHFAKLLSDAYRQGAQDHALAYKETHAQIVSLANAALERVKGLEKLLNQMLRDVREDALAARDELDDARERAREEAPVAGGGGISDVVKSMVGARVAAGVAAATAGAAPDAKKASA